MIQPTLRTRRLVLRPFRAADAPLVSALAGAREVADTTLNIPHPYEQSAAEVWVATLAPSFAAGERVTYAVTTGQDASLVGAVSITLNATHASGELGYWIAVPCWGLGYATEAAEALCAVAFSTLRVHRIQAHHLTRNPASGRVMQKLGMRHEGTLLGAARRWGRFEDLALYAVLEDEWAAADHAVPVLA